MNDAGPPFRLPAASDVAANDGASNESRKADEPRAPVLPPRIRRMVELVYAVEGVTAARVWHWPGRVSVGVRPSMRSAPSELLRRVEHAVAGLREPDETWDFGLLETDN